MHAFMKQRVTLNAVGELSCQFDALKYVTSFENNKAPALQSRKYTHVTHTRTIKDNTHTYRKADVHTQGPIHIHVHVTAITHRHTGYIKIKVRGVRQIFSHLARWNTAATARIRCFFPAAQSFNGRYPTVDGQTLVFSISQYITRGVYIPSSSLSTSHTPTWFLHSLPLQDWCFLFIKHQADIPWI